MFIEFMESTLKVELSCIGGKQTREVLALLEFMELIVSSVRC